MSPERIELTIGELALDGFEAVDGALVGQLLERELARLIGQRGLPPGLAAGSDWPALDGLSFQLGAGAGAEAVAAGVAEALYGGLAR